MKLLIKLSNIPMLTDYEINTDTSVEDARWEIKYKLADDIMTPRLYKNGVMLSDNLTLVEAGVVENDILELVE